MATLLSHSRRRFLRLLKPNLRRTLSPTMTTPSPPHFPAGNLPPGFGPSGWSNAPPQWHRALCTHSSDPRSSSGICDADLAAVEGAASPDVVQVSADDGWVETSKSAQKGDSETNLDRTTFKIMTYNVWSDKYMHLSSRMSAVGDLIQHHTPDLICLQEVTPDIYQLLINSDWWGKYECSLSSEWAMKRKSYCIQMSKLTVDSFGRHSAKGRELWTADVSIGGVTMMLATSHLVSPSIPPGTWHREMYSYERVAQARKSLMILGSFPNVIFGGDMNWDDKEDGPFPLPDGWVDAWTELRPGEDGWTYDTRANAMLSANPKLQKRLDRFVCRLADFDMDGIEMIGKEAVPGVSYEKRKTVRGVARELVLPVLPSDHFGLVLTITRRQAGSASSPDSE